MTPKELQEARAVLRMTQQTLANALGVARNTVARWEMGGWAIPSSIDLAMKALVMAKTAMVWPSARATTPTTTETPRTNRPTPPPRRRRAS